MTTEEFIAWVVAVNDPCVANTSNIRIDPQSELVGELLRKMMEALHEDDRWFACHASDAGDFDLWWGDLFPEGRPDEVGHIAPLRNVDSYIAFHTPVPDVGAAEVISWSCGQPSGDCIHWPATQADIELALRCMMARLRATGRSVNCGETLVLKALDSLDPYLDVDDPYACSEAYDDDDDFGDELDDHFDEMGMP